MELFDQINRSLTKSGQAAIKKTKDISEINKLNSAISDAEKKVQIVYRDLGKAYFEKHGLQGEGEFAHMLGELNYQLTNIAQWTLEIKRLKGICQCTVCGRDMDISTPFCSNCGAKNEKKPRENVCSCCGAPLAPDAPFCSNCGTKNENAPRENVCPHCGVPAAPNVAFCSNCGGKLK